MISYVLTSAAEDDLRNILEFLVVESPAAARRVLDALQEAMRLLGERPGIGHRRTDLADEALRFWPVFSYLVIYRPETTPVQVIASCTAHATSDAFWRNDVPALAMRRTQHDAFACED